MHKEAKWNKYSYLDINGDIKKSTVNMQKGLNYLIWFKNVKSATFLHSIF